MRTVEEVIKNHKHICWYPSAGADLRVLMFLSEQYCRWKGVDLSEDELPDLFVLTDCNPTDVEYSERRGISSIARINDGYPEAINHLYYSFDGSTDITLNSYEELEKIDIPYDGHLFTLGCSEHLGQALLMSVHIKSRQLGEWDTELLYLLAENTAFALKYLVPKQIKMEYIIRVRYGDAFGGSALAGEWLLKLIPALRVKYFLSNEISEEAFAYVPEQLATGYEDMKNVWGNTDVLPLKEIYCVNGRSWSKQGDIHWYKVENACAAEDA